MIEEPYFREINLTSANSGDKHLHGTMLAASQKAITRKWLDCVKGLG